ncbi:MAG: hypothetical protein H8K03_14145 [Nitrospira sp.]|nr:hypothetical protein [Nitrospira sp. BO4]
MKTFRLMTLGIVSSLFLVACASQTKQPVGDPSARITATGYTQDGCLLNLKLEARQRNMRLNPEDVEVGTNWFSFFFPILNHEGYQCSGSGIAGGKRVFNKDPFYPVE